MISFTPQNHERVGFLPGDDELEFLFGSARAARLGETSTTQFAVTVSKQPFSIDCGRTGTFVVILDEGCARWIKRYETHSPLETGHGLMHVSSDVRSQTADNLSSHG